MIRTVIIAGTISAQGTLIRMLEGGLALIDAGGKEVTGRLVGPAPAA